MDTNIEQLRKKYELTNTDFIKNASDIFNELSFLTSKSENPKFIIIGGQAGAGKTDLVSKKYNELKGNAIIIDQDELRTKYPQPAYDEIITNYDDRTEFLILNLHTKEKRYNIIIESALQDVDAFVEYALELNLLGYSSQLAVLSSPELEANISMLYRYCYYLEKDGVCRRNTRINLKARHNMCNNIQKMNNMNIFDDIEIYIRNTDRTQFPNKIYSKKENKLVAPTEAFERAEKLSMDDTIKNFERKYQYIKSILDQYKEKEKLETLENLYNKYITLLNERE